MSLLVQYKLLLTPAPANDSFFKVGNLLMFGMEPDHPLKFLLVSV